MPRPKSRTPALIGVLVLLALIAVGVFGKRALDSRQRLALRSQSVATLEGRVKDQPNNLEMRYALGLAYAREERYPDAVREFLALLEKDPVRPDVLNDLGVAYLLQRRHYESLVSLQGALRADPNFASAYANLGRLHIATQMPFTAVRELEKATQLQKPTVSDLCDLGQAYQRTLNYKSAEKVYKQALAIDPKSAIAYTGLGQTFYSMTNYEESEKALKSAIALSPEDTITQISLARLYVERAKSGEETQEAERMLLGVTKSDPNDPEGWYQLGKLYTRGGKNPEALEMQTRALRLNSSHMGAMHQLALCLRAVGRTADADRLAKIHQDRAMQERKLNQLEERLSRVPNDWDALGDLAEIYLQTGKSDLATLLVRRMQNEKPDHPKMPKLLMMLRPSKTETMSPSLGGGRP